MRIHRMPECWKENADGLAREVADTIRATGATVSARVMFRGGWRVGYSTKGNYAVTVAWERGWKHKNPESVMYRGLPDVGRISRWWSKHSRGLYLARTWNTVLGWYRASGLIPPRVAKKHAAILRGSEGEKETIALKLAAKYIIKKAKCPHCGKRGFDEQLMGFECRHCASWWNEEQGKWNVAK